MTETLTTDIEIGDFYADETDVEMDLNWERIDAQPQIGESDGFYVSGPLVSIMLGSLKVTRKMLVAMIGEEAVEAIERNCHEMFAADMASDVMEAA